MTKMDRFHRGEKTETSENKKTHQIEVLDTNNPQATIDLMHGIGNVYSVTTEHRTLTLLTVFHLV